MSRIYVKSVTIELSNYKNMESLLDEAILKETKTGGIFKAITSFQEQGTAFYTLVFERM